MDLPKRKKNRLSSFDYSSNGVYFVTICTQNHKNTLCSISKNGDIFMKEPGRLAKEYINCIPLHYPGVSVDKYVIMPNHIHMLLRFERSEMTALVLPALGSIIGWYKYNVTKQINAVANTVGEQFFQRSFYDHVIRGEEDYTGIWEYIDNNPLKWQLDRFYIED